jgi:hypothetical protein
VDGMAKSTYLKADTVCGRCNPELAGGFPNELDNEFQSFVRERENINVKLLIDAKDCFASMAEAMISATQDVIQLKFSFLLFRN